MARTPSMPDHHSSPWSRRTFLQTAALASLASLGRASAAPPTQPIYPDNKAYDTARSLFNSRLDKRPAAIQLCHSEQEIISAIQTAKKRQLPVSIKSGGHCFEGFSMNDGSLAVDLSGMNSLSLRPSDQVLRVQPGAKLQQINDYLIPKGRILPAGSCGGVGIGGLTLGGGYGLLAREFGLTCDQLIALRMVDAEGKSHYLSGKSELLKACRGGGNGNFGVVSEFYFRTQPLPSHLYNRRFYAKNLSPERVAELLALWFEASAKLPNDAFSAFVLNGKNLMILLTHTQLQSRNAITQAFNKLEKAVDRSTRYYAPKFPYAIKRYYGRPGPLPFKNASAGMYQQFGDIAAIVQQLAQQVIASPGLIWQVNTLGGAIQNPSFESASTYPHRSCPWLGEIQGYWQHSKHAQATITAVERFQQSIAEHGIQRHYRNYPDSNFSSPQQSYYAQHLALLKKVKQQYDPNNLFASPQGLT